MAGGMFKSDLLQTLADPDAYHRMKVERRICGVPAKGGKHSLAKWGLQAWPHVCIVLVRFPASSYQSCQPHSRFIRCGKTCLRSRFTFLHAGHDDDREQAGPLQREILEKLAAGEPWLQRCV